MFYKLKKRILQAGLNKRKKTKPFDEKACELFQISESDPHEINNSYFLGGHTAEGEDLTLRMGMRNGGLHELFVIYRRKMKDGSFQVLYQEKDHYAAEEMPLTIICEEVGQRWRYRFDGHLRDAEGQRYAVSFDMLFTATLPIYDFIQYPDRHEGMTSAIAREKWSGKFFKTLELTSQKHYEQVGRIAGTISVDHVDRTIAWSAVRDRALGKRVWDYMDAHIWINVTTEKGEALMFSVVSYPSMKSLFTGYSTLGSTDGRYASLVTYAQMETFEHSEGKGPEHCKFYTEWSDGRTIILEAWRDTNVYCTFDNGDYFFQEGLGNVRLNGAMARGNLEYGYNKNPERWGQYRIQS